MHPADIFRNLLKAILLLYCRSKIHNPSGWYSDSEHTTEQTNNIRYKYWPEVAVLCC